MKITPLKVFIGLMFFVAFFVPDISNPLHAEWLKTVDSNSCCLPLEVRYYSSTESGDRYLDYNDGNWRFIINDSTIISNNQQAIEDAYAWDSTDLETHTYGSADGLDWSFSCPFIFSQYTSCEDTSTTTPTTTRNYDGLNKNEQLFIAGVGLFFLSLMSWKRLSVIRRTDNLDV